MRRLRSGHVILFFAALSFLCCALFSVFSEKLLSPDDLASVGIKHAVAGNFVKATSAARIAAQNGSNRARLLLSYFSDLQPKTALDLFFKDTHFPLLVTHDDALKYLQLAVAEDDGPAKATYGAWLVRGNVRCEKTESGLVCAGLHENEDWKRGVSLLTDVLKKDQDGYALATLALTDIGLPIGYVMNLSRSGKGELVQGARASKQADRESEARATTALPAATEATTAHPNATADEPVHRGSIGSSAPTTTQPDPPNAGSKACATEAQIQVCVSSVLPTAGVNTADYGPQSLFDSETADAWVEGEDDDGIGQWIVLSWSAPRPVRGFVIANGYGKSPGLFKSNSRVRSMLLSFAGGEQAELQLDDSSKQRQYLLERTITTTWVRFEIRDVIRGSRYRDTAISGLRPMFE